MPARSYAVLGTGALGGYYGARLHHAGLDLHFLLHSDYAHVRAHGLTVESKYGDFSIAEPAVYERAVDLPPCDVAMVCLKTTHNHLLPELLAHAVKPDGWVLMMQNGLGVEAAAAAVVPENPILGGLAFLCSNKIGPGHIRHLDYGEVRLAEYRGDGEPAGITDRVVAVAEDLRRAGISVELEEDLELARWKKLVWNITYNGLCVLHDCTTDVLMSDAATRSLCRSVMREVLRASEACGHHIDQEFVTFMLDNTDKMASYKPSMKLDYELGRPLEIEAIYGNPLRAAQAAGAVCPLIAEIYVWLLELDAGNRA